MDVDPAVARREVASETVPRLVAVDTSPRLATGWRVVLGVALAGAVAVRFVAHSHFWLDEALTFNIARLPLGDIPEALRHDGAPPLYYLLLHFWTEVVGTSVLAVRALSGVFAAAALPLIWLAGRRLGGRMVAAAALVLLASSPFAMRYATEARMYSLVMLLVLGGGLALARVTERRSTGAMVALGLMTGLLLLTHYWSFYLVLVVGAVLLVRAVAGDGGARRALLAMAAGGLLFLPWLPSFLYQMRYTGAPWGLRGGVRTFLDSLTDFAGGFRNPGVVLTLMFQVLIGLAVFGRAVDGRRIEIDLRTRRPGGLLALVAFGTLGLGLLVGRLTGEAYASRYASIVFPLVILLVALGIGVLADRRLRVVLLAGAVALALPAIEQNARSQRTSARRVANAIKLFNPPPGDIVAYCPDQLGPSVSRLLPPELGLVQLTFPRARPPQFVDWVDYREVNEKARPGAFARMLLDRAGRDSTIWLVWAGGYRTFGGKCERLHRELGWARPNRYRVTGNTGRTMEHFGLTRYPPGSTKAE
jgi:mannosyltransferase